MASGPRVLFGGIELEVQNHPNADGFVKTKLGEHYEIQ